MDQQSSQPMVPKSGPKDVFLHLLAIVTLYASVISFIALAWQYINTWFPDPLNYYFTSVLNAMRWSASVLVVMFPVYVLVTWLINRGYRKEPARREIRVRKWLIYLTLFISAITVIIDVITLVYNLLGGEFTERFVLKVLVVLVAGLAVFAYYLWDLRNDGSQRNLKILAWVVSLVVLAEIIGAFFVIGSPAKQRSINFDNQRESDLATIQSQIINYWESKSVMPQSLADLTDSISGYKAPLDPETGQPYEYNLQSGLNFQLCATFDLPSQDSNTTPTAKLSVPYPAGISPFSDNWTHGAGRTCFDRTIDPQKYKPVAS